MIYDSTNPRVMADNISRLEKEIASGGGGGSSLPAVTPSDEGKVLTVNHSGQWDAENPATELPSVTTTDEGKVLTVNSSGEWIADNPAEELPDTTSASAGQILKLDSNKEPKWNDEYSYTPPAYSLTEVNTGKKWIDGKDVYLCVFDIGGAGSITLAHDNWTVSDVEVAFIETVISCFCVGNDGVSLNYIAAAKKAENNKLQIYSTRASDVNTRYAVLEYTKVTPVTSTRKKSTK